MEKVVTQPATPVAEKNITTARDESQQVLKQSKNPQSVTALQVKLGQSAVKPVPWTGN